MTTDFPLPPEFLCERVFWMPHYAAPTEEWGHLPFAFWVTGAVRPRRLVQLGVGFGTSYFAFCQTIEALGLDTECTAIDPWPGDQEQAHAEATKENTRYGMFSELFRSDPRDTIARFPDGSIDLLYIADDSSARDIQLWLPKLSAHGVLLLRGEVALSPASEHGRPAGVPEHLPCFTFAHSGGLGVFGAGPAQTNAMETLFRTWENAAGRAATCAFFRFLGEAAANRDRLRGIDGQTRLIAQHVQSLSDEVDRSFAGISRYDQQSPYIPAENGHGLMDHITREIESSLGKIEHISRLTDEISDLVIRYWRKPLSIFRKSSKRTVYAALSGTPGLPSRARSRFHRKATNLTAEAQLLGLRERVFPPPAAPRTALPPSTPIAQSKNSRVWALERAMLQTREGSYESALPLFADLDRITSRPGAELGSFFKEPNLPSQHGPLAVPSGFPLPDRAPGSIPVYTAIFGGYDELPPVLTSSRLCDFICFTDQDISAPGWRIIKAEPRQRTNLLSVKHYKFFPEEYFPDHDCSMFVDGNTMFWGELDGFIRRWLLGNDFVHWRHPERSDYIAEAETIISLARAPAEIVARQIAAYENAGVPRHAGLVESSFIWRRHGNPAVRAFMETWWQEVTTKSGRDQLSHYMISHTGPLAPPVLPDRLGTARVNVVFMKIPHHRAPRKLSPRATPGPRKVRFLGDTASDDSQLAAFLSAALTGDLDIAAETDVTKVADSLVIVTRDGLQNLTPDDIETLKLRNVAVGFDPGAEVPAPEPMRVFDFLLSGSLKAHRAFLDDISLPLPFHLTRPGNPMIKAVAPTGGMMKTACLQDRALANVPQAVTSMIDFLSPNAPESLRHIGRYNAHWAIQQAGAKAAPRPFTEGFIAARCNAVILCDRDAGDNVLYLGDDYPFFAPGPDPADLEYFLLNVGAGFGGSEWQRAREQMRFVADRSSPDWVLQEFRHILRAVYDN